MGKSLERSVDAVSATLSAGDGSASPKRNQKGISHKEVHFVFKSSSHPKSPLKPGQEESLPGHQMSNVAG